MTSKEHTIKKKRKHEEEDSPKTTGEEQVKKEKLKKKDKKEKKDKKDKKKEKKEKEEDVESKKDKKSKKKQKEKSKSKTEGSKKKHKSNSSTESSSEDESINEKPSKSSEAVSEGSWNNWSAASFANDERKDKFLRLLGAKKSGEKEGKKKGLFGSLGKLPSSSADDTANSAIDADYAKKVNSALEKQFENGLKLRKQQFKGRGGLGFNS
ncbi:hypothetical protein K7432_004897 [Basidiobolus ranarum]|uniref:Small acidic protein n=1 Tax=Basidiobolus ranarum TaxID=34480 RepID=A0ABR2W3Y9_9FUNG